jgi:urocanate reductase
MDWNLSTDVVVIGAGAAGLAAAVSACDHGAAVILVEENYDIGGHAMLSGGRVHLGGGNALQKKFGIKDSPEQIFADWTTHKRGDGRYNDRELVHAFAEECVPTFQFLLDNGVTFIEKPIVTPDASTVPRVFVTHEWHVPGEVIAPRRNRNGSGLVRRLAESARNKGVQILLKHEMAQIVRDGSKGRVRGIVAKADGRDVAIEARKGIVIATGGHTGNVNFRRMFDPRLTEEYQQAGMPYSFQGADGEIAAMEIGASLWATGTQTSEVGPAITKTRHVGTRWGYLSLYYETDSPIFNLCKATGLTVTDWHEAILVNRFGKRFWN